MTSQKVRIVSEGHGGTVAFELPHGVDYDKQNVEEQSTNLIGTYGCLTCVGIYLKIDRDRAFAAHVQAHKGTNDGKGSAFLTLSDGLALKTCILDKLRREARAHEWDWDQVNKESLILACQHPEDSILCPSAGRWIIAAVQEFLNIADTSKFERFGAFIVDHESAEIVVCEAAKLLDTQPRSFDKFDLIVAGAEGWRFEV